jgi:hypothetical protein
MVSIGRLLLVCTLAGLPGTVFAQTSTQSVDSARAALHSAQRNNQRVRVAIVNAPTIEGRLARVDLTSARVVGGSVFELSSIDSVQVRYAPSDPFWNGILIGAVIAAPIGRLGAEGLASIGEFEEFTKTDRIAAWIGGAIFGAMVGFMVDAARVGEVTWHTAVRR